MLVGSSSTFWMRPVRPLDDAQFLFELLNERAPRANISHKKMPTYTSHVNFIKSKPYKKWYIVFVVRKLSGKNTEDLLAGYRVNVNEQKENPLDFVLWKPSLDDDPGWDSPWGFGRPGWHLSLIHI